MRPVPHEHRTPEGEVELCYDRLCTRVTTSQTHAATLGGVVLVAMIVAVAVILSRG